MRPRLLSSILFLTILIPPMVSPVLAQTNHTLEWGVSTGEEFTYVLQRAHFADGTNRVFIEAQLPFLAVLQVGQKVILEIDDLDTIANQINESSQLPHSYSNLLRENDSEVIMSGLTGLVVPIGDWEFLNDVENITGTEGLTLVETEEEWGTIGIGLIIDPGAPDITVHIETRYEKENGTLSYLRHRYSTLGEDIIDVIFVHWYPGMPTIVGGGIQTTTLLIIAISGATVVIVAVMVYRRVTGRKPIIQQLGE